VVYSSPVGMKMIEAQLLGNQSLNVYQNYRGLNQAMMNGKPIVDPITGTRTYSAELNKIVNILVDPVKTVRLLTTAAPWGIKAPTSVILAHEMGHATFLMGDGGPNRMDNVNISENPFREWLGVPLRSTY
jgi:hypothetical protein